MGVSEKDSCRFVWKIENFSMCPHNFKESLESPTYTAECLGRTRWKLKVYPRGIESPYYVACFLMRTGDDDCVEDITVGFALAVYSDAGKRNIINHGKIVFKKRESSGWPEFATRKVIFDTVNGYVPCDILTLTCVVWKVRDTTDQTNSFNDFIAHFGEEINRFNRDKFKRNSTTTVTRIEVGRQTLLWPIRKFSDLKHCSSPVTIKMKGDPLCYLRLCFKLSASGSVSIEITRTKSTQKACLVKCKITAVNKKELEITYREEDTYLFDTSSNECVWKFPMCFDKNALRNNSAQDILYLLCDFTISTPQNLHHINHPDMNHSRVPMSLKPTEPLWKEATSRSLEEFSRVTIRTKDRDFQVAKTELTASSPVFCAMFENGMKEKETGEVEVVDIDSVTMDLLLDFLCTGFLWNLSVENALNLYSASNKYQVFPLKSLCSCFLKFHMSVSNVCSILLLADMHEDENLMEDASHFIFINRYCVFASQEWNDLMKSNSVLTGGIMHSVLMNIMP